jgi:beta-glucanase (GH16 family)
VATARPADAAVPARSVNGATGAVKRVLLHDSVSTAGVYDVTVRVTSHPPAGDVVKLKIGKFTRRATTARHTHRVTVRQRVAIRGHRLTISASARSAVPTISVSWRRVKTLPASGPSPIAVVAPASQPKTLASTGSTGSSGLSGSSAPASPAAPTTDASGPIGDPGNWRSIFDDEFNANTLDTTNWSTGWLGNSITGPMNTEELECYDPAQAIEAGGELDLNLIAQPTQNCQLAGGPTTVNEPYDSAMITTRNKFNYTYGFLETRVWLPGTTTGVDWPGIWAVGNNWPTDGELDLVEGLGGEACWHFHDPSGAPGGCSNATYTGGWHTFGADWEPGNVTWYYDGTQIGTATTAITTAPMYLIADLAIDNTYGGPTQAPATLRIDYIRIWQH